MKRKTLPKTFSEMVNPWGILHQGKPLGDVSLFESGAAISLECMAVFLEFSGFDFSKTGMIFTNV